MDKEYKGLKENIERFKNDLTDENTRLLFSIAYKQGYDKALTIQRVSQQRELLKAFYKSVEDDYLYPEELDMHVDYFLDSL